MQKAIITIIILLLLLVTVSFAEIAWQYDAGDGITVKPIVSGNTIFIATQDGNVHAISASGKLVWKRQVGKYVLQPFMIDNTIVAANNNGTITKIEKDGSINSQISLVAFNPGVKVVYGIDSYQGKIYLTTNVGVLAIQNNNVTTFFNTSDARVYTAPTVAGTKIIFGAGNELVVMNLNKQVIWRKNVGDLWDSKPVLENSIVYVGATDNFVYAFDAGNGDLKWKYRTDGWIASSPTVKDGVLYVGSEDGHVYALDALNGNLKWNAKTDQAVRTTPLVMNFGGKDALIVGSTDGKLYAIDRQNGKIVWKFVAGDWVASPIAIKNNVIVGSKNNLLYSIKTERGCTINEPEDKTTVGQKEIKLVGSVVSNADNAGVSVRVNEGEWKTTNVNGEDWQLKIDPNGMKIGPNKIFCKTSDDRGEESEPYYSMTLLKSSNVSKSKMIISAPKTSKINEQFIIFVNDGDDNSPIEDFTIKYGGKEQTATGNVTLNISTAGRLNIVVSKTGFDNATVDVEIKGPGSLADMALPAVVGLILLALFYFFVVKRFMLGAKKS